MGHASLALLLLTTCFGASSAMAGDRSARTVTRVVIEGGQARGDQHWRDPGVFDGLNAWQERRFWREQLHETDGANVRWWHGLPVVRHLKIGEPAASDWVAELVAELVAAGHAQGLSDLQVQARIDPLGKHRAQLVLSITTAMLPTKDEEKPPIWQSDAAGGVARVELEEAPRGWHRRAGREQNLEGVWKRVDQLAHRAGVERAEISLAQSPTDGGYIVGIDMERSAQRTVSPIVDITAPGTLWGGGLGLRWTGVGMPGAVPRAGISGAAGYVVYQGWAPKIDFQTGNHGPTAHLAGSLDVARDLATLRAHGGARFDLLAQPGYRGVLGTGVLGGAWQPRKNARMVFGLRSSAWHHRAPVGQGAAFDQLFVDGPAPAHSRGQVLATHLSVDVGDGPRAIVRPRTRVQAQIAPVGWVVSGSDVQRFHRGWARADLVRSLGDRRLMGMVSAEGGLLVGEGGPVAALTERFHLGSGSLPGRGWAALPPAGLAFPDSDEPRIGGEVMAAVRGELRFDIAHGLHGIAHGNVGRTWIPSVSPVKLADLVPAAGAGVGVLTPLGRIDLLAVAWLGPWPSPGPPPPRIGFHLFLVP